MLSTKFGKRYTSKRLSPIVGAEKPPAPPKPPAVDPNADCDGDGTKNARRHRRRQRPALGHAGEEPEARLAATSTPTATASRTATSTSRRCDLNDDEHQSPNNSTPYPEKRPYPNALDKTDADTDHDGDTLTLTGRVHAVEVHDPQGRGAHAVEPLSYSAGEQYSVRAAQRRTRALAAAGYDKQAEFRAWATGAGYLQRPARRRRHHGRRPVDGDDWWAARPLFDIRDFDRDGNHRRDGDLLRPRRQRRSSTTPSATRTPTASPNQWETHRLPDRASTGPALYDKETKYYLTYAGVRLDDEDTDGDGVRDGADDQDHDDVPNVMECSRVLRARRRRHRPRHGGPDHASPAGPGEGFVNPFNPCLPHLDSRTCKQLRRGRRRSEWAPFNPDDDVLLDQELAPRSLPPDRPRPATRRASVVS